MTLEMTNNSLKDRIFSNKGLINFIQKIKAGKKFLILNTILNFLGGPLFMAMMLTYAIDTKTNHPFAPSMGSENLVIYGIVGVIASVIALGSGMFIALSNFDYLYKKSNVDMIYALPLTRKQRFISDYFSGLFLYVVPFLVASIVTLILTFSLEQYLLANAEILYYSTDDLNIWSSLLHLVFEGFLMIVVSMVLFYTLTVFTTTFAGNMIAAVQGALAINVLVPLAILLSGLMVQLNNFGMESEYPFQLLLIVTSPIGGIIYFYEYFTAGISGGSYYTTLIHNAETLFTQWTLLTIVVIIALFFGGYYLNKYRKTEDVAKPFPYRAFYYILMATLTYIIVLIFCMAVSNDDRSAIFVPAFIIIGIIWLVQSVIINKGFKNILKSAIGFVLATTLSFFGIYVYETTGGFGEVYRVPSASSVQSVTLNYTGYYTPYEQWYNIDESLYSVTINEAENIETIVNAHNQIIYNYKASGDNQSYHNYDEIIDYNFEISYKMNNGTVMKREYVLTADIVSQHLVDLEQSEEFLDSAVDFLKRFYEYDDMITDGETHTLNITSLIENNPNRIDLIVTPDIAKELSEAYKKDIMAMTKEEYLSSSAKTIGELNYEDYRFYLYESHENMIAVLKKYGVTDEDFDSIRVTEDYMKEVLLDTTLFWSVPTTSTVDNGYSYYGDLQEDIRGILAETEFTDEMIKDFVTMFEYGKEYYFFDETGYMIVIEADKIGYYNFRVPVELNDIASKYQVEGVTAL